MKKVQIYMEQVNQVINDKAVKYITAEKKQALANDKKFQELKKALESRKTEILTPITNRLYVHKLAIHFGKLWNIDTDKLESFMIDDKGTILRDGKPFAISTNSQAASFMSYLHDTLTKKTLNKSDKQHELYILVCGGLEWISDIDAVCEKVAKQQKTTKEEVLKAYNRYKDSENK